MFGILKTKFLITFFIFLFFGNTNLFSWTKLMKASCKGSLKSVKKSLDLNDIHRISKKETIKEIGKPPYKQIFPKGCDAFTIAALCGHQEITAVLFEKLGDDYTPPAFDSYGITSLMIAVISGVTILIQREFEKDPAGIYKAITQPFGKFPQGSSLVNLACWTKNQAVIRLVQSFYTTNTSSTEPYQPSDKTLVFCLEKLHDEYE